jgi:hypothetical protein
VKNLDHIIRTRHFVCPANPLHFFILCVGFSILLLIAIFLSSCQQHGVSDTRTMGNFPYIFKVQKKIDRDSYIFDLDHDAKKEIIIFMSEGHARALRGVFVYEGETITLRWKFKIGPAIPTKPYLIDSNNDNYMEILFPTSAPSNGYQKNGGDDQHSYLFLLDYQGKLIWRREFGGRYTTVNLKYVDLNGNGRKEIIAFFNDNSQTELHPRLELINPLTGSPSRIQELPVHSASWALLNTDRCLQKEIVVLGNDGNILLLDHKLQMI